MKEIFAAYIKEKSSISPYPGAKITTWVISLILQRCSSTDLKVSPGIYKHALEVIYVLSCTN